MSPANFSGRTRQRGAFFPTLSRDTWKRSLDPGIASTGDLQIAATRLVVALGAFVLVAQFPSDDMLFRSLAQAWFLAYALLSTAVLLVLTFHGMREHWSVPWIEFGFVACLVLATNDSDSPFLFLLLLPITAAASFGEKQALAILACSVTYLVLLLNTQTHGSRSLSALAPLLAVTALGYLLARLRGVDVENRARLAVLAKSSRSADVRVGCDRLISMNLDALRVHFRATSALLVVQTVHGTTTRLYRSDDGQHELPPPEDMAHATERWFFELPEEPSIYPMPIVQRWVDRLRETERLPSSSNAGAGKIVAELLEATFLLSTQYRQSDGAQGRLVVTRNGDRFSPADLAFLDLFARSLAVIAANACLTEELVANAAEDERANISRDLHDTAVQPYLGIRLALQCMARDLAKDTAIVERLQRISEIADTAVDELRAYTARLRGRTASPTISLHAAIERHAARLARFYGLSVDVELDPQAPIEGPLADAVFHIVAEGLSNVLRHTTSNRARVAIGRERDVIVVAVANQRLEGSAAPDPFIPRSIHERAQTLGGSTAVESIDEWTAVRVRLPTLQI